MRILDVVHFIIGLLDLLLRLVLSLLRALWCVCLPTLPILIIATCVALLPPSMYGLAIGVLLPVSFVAMLFVSRLMVEHDRASEFSIFGVVAIIIGVVCIAIAFIALPEWSDPDCRLMGVVMASASSGLLLSAGWHLLQVVQEHEPEILRTIWGAPAGCG